MNQIEKIWLRNKLSDKFDQFEEAVKSGNLISHSSFMIQMRHFEFYTEGKYRFDYISKGVGGGVAITVVCRKVCRKKDEGGYCFMRGFIILDEYTEIHDWMKEGF